MSCTRSGLLSFVPVILGIGGLSGTVLGQCQGWLPGEGTAVTGGEYRAAAMFDPDGPGPQSASLFVGGDFAAIGGSPGDFIYDLASWDGSRWRAAGPMQLNGRVNALAVFDLDGDGPNPPRLIVGGQFQAGVVPNQMSNIFAWDEQNATRLSTGFNNEVLALHVFDPDRAGPLPPQLYAAGRFNFSGATPLSSSVARWNGTAWESPASGLSGAINALTTFDPDGPGEQPPMLVAGGQFNRNGLPSHLAGLSGTQWSNIGAGFNNAVLSVTTFDFDGDGKQPARLLAAGLFTSAGSSTSLLGQAYFNGTSWQPIAPVNLHTVISSGRSLGVFDPDGPGGLPAQLFLGGNIILPNESFPHRFVTYQDGAWAPLSPDNLVGEVLAMSQLVLPGESDPVLFVAGTLTGIQPSVSLRLAVVEGQQVRAFQDGFGGLVRGLGVTHVGGGESVVAVGDFTRVPGAPARGVAIYRDGAWSQLGPISSDFILGQAVYSYDPDGDGPLAEVLVVGGVFNVIGDVPALNVAQWDGTQWASMGNGLPYYPTQFVMYDIDGPGSRPAVLLASGDAPSGGPGDAARLMQWDGNSWTQFGPDFVTANGPAQITRVTTMDPDGAGPLPRVLIVTGFFNRVGTVLANNVASFDGTQWRPLTSGVNSNPQSLYTWDRTGDGHEVVVLGGIMNTAGGVPVRGVAVWNGTTWSALGTGFGPTPQGFPTYPSGLVAFDIDGTGPVPSQLYATGFFTQASGMPAAGIARWNGTTWESLGSGLDAPAGYSLAVLHDSAGGAPTAPTLFVGGAFQAAGGLASSFVARYSIQACCSADFNADGYVTSQDLFDFLTAFFALAPAADINHDSFINSADFFELLTGLFGGC